MNLLDTRQRRVTIDTFLNLFILSILFLKYFIDNKAGKFNGFALAVLLIFDTTNFEDTIKKLQFQSFDDNYDVA